MPARVLGPTVAGHNDAECEAMLAAFGALSLSTAIAAKKRRLPFLRRIVRTSFFRRCRMMGVALDSVASQTQSLTILYKIPMDLSDNESDNEVTEYSVYEVKLAVDQLLCPLCDTLGRLITKEMLEAHLKWDHIEVEASWRIRKDESWELALELTGDELEVVESEEVALSYSSSHSSVRPWPPNGELPVSDTDPGEFETGTHNIATHVEHPVSYFFKFKPESSPTPASSIASLTPAAVGNRLHRAPIAGDPLGPLGVYPYLPLIPTNNDDSLSLSFSCRPCGPRLFDLVARYPMSDYGLTSWSLLERDEELFEIDDIRDEEKAMQALWNRWIVSRRRGYLLDPCKSVVEFVDTFHPTIVETAGWKGVRVWLLLLAKHKYLTGDDVVTVMRFYETITST
ncbi:hypothetical protein BC827DRAFT_487818 [Russula dissimulans]|nr:hypothetical protein BC827DRAFT_487818 [Russula dissimulans]